MIQPERGDGDGRSEMQYKLMKVRYWWRPNVSQDSRWWVVWHQLITGEDGDILVLVL